MTDRNDGGAAFPGAVPDYIDHPVYGHTHRAQVGMEVAPGMSLRDWFAGQALSIIPTRRWEHLGSDAAIIEHWARTSYAVADAMLSARNEGGK